MGNRRDRRSRDDSAREPGVRSQRLEEIFREELNSILDSEVSDRDLQDSRVTLVELSPDGSRARVWFVMVTNEPRVRETEAAFMRACGFIRSRLCEALPLKRMPELRFRHDPAAVAVTPLLSRTE